MKPVEIQHYGEIGAGRVLAFIPKDTVSTVYLPDGQTGEHLGTCTIRGNSLIKLGIYDGDTLIFNRKFSKKQVTPRTVCVLYAHGELMARVVLFDVRPGMLTLRAASEDKPDQYADPQDVEIWGVMVGFQRMFRPGETIMPDPDIPF